ncbi:hypothetical protein OG698_17970 [Streptomyces sp. NBC_01003]|uniref:hypothetical protein n=1 Tax=Streptomyces sp. NBC_01003 TaxID=2903714 RepID=UPI00386F865A|nr:hypothetical protein OG698_17970 [Streptomyces sp. NBC_01003]
MLMLQKVVIAAATVGGLVALGSGSAYAADYGDSVYGGTRPFAAVGLLGDATPQAQERAEKKREAQEKSILRTVGLPDGLLEVPRQLAGTTTGGTNQNNQVNGVSGGVNQNNQSISVSGGVNQNNQSISASGAVNQNNQANGSSGGTNQNNQANGSSGGVNQNNQVNGVSGGVNQNNQANGTSGGVNQNNQANGVSGGVNQNNQATGFRGGINQNNQVNRPTIAFVPAIQPLNLKQAQTVSGD